jgi:hypothetical protein
VKTVLKPTDEMVGTVLTWRQTRGTLAVDLVTELLALIERDNRVTPLCLDELAPELRCDDTSGHPGSHNALAPSGSRVTWGVMTRSSPDGRGADS